MSEHEASGGHEYCCKMRRHFIVGIVASRADEPAPVNMADFVIEWVPQPVIQIKYCPFCGAELNSAQEVRTT